MSIRKTLLLLMAIFTMAAVSAQNVRFDQQPEGKALRRKMNVQFVDGDGQNTLLMEYTGRLKNKMSLVSYNNAQKELARVDMGKSDDTRFYGGFINGEYADLLEANYSETGMRVVRDRRNKETLVAEGEPLVLVEYNGEKQDDFGIAVAPSPNQQLLACAFVAERQLIGTQITVGLYNHELEEYWKMQLGDINFNSISVTDDGDVVLYSFNTNGTCNFTVVDGEKKESYTFTIESDATVRERELVYFGNGKIVVASTVSMAHSGRLPEGSDIDRLDISCYNIKNGEVTTQSHTFTDQEILRMANEKETKKVRQKWIHFGQIAQTLSDKNGGYVVLDETWSVSLNGVKTEQHRCGMMVVRVSANGEIEWVRTKRMITNTSWDDREFLGYRWRTFGDGIALVMTDHKWNASAPEEKQAKPMAPLKEDANLTVWTINSSGEENFSHLFVDNKAMYGAMHYIGNGRYEVLLCGKNKGQFVLISPER